MADDTYALGTYVLMIVQILAAIVLAYFTKVLSKHAMVANQIEKGRDKKNDEERRKADFGEAIRLSGEVINLDAQEMSYKIVKFSQDVVHEKVKPIEGLLRYQHLLSQKNKALIVRLLADMIGYADSIYLQSFVVPGQDVILKQIYQLKAKLVEERTAWLRELSSHLQQ